MLPEPLGFQEQFPYAQQTGYLADASLSYDAPPELVAFLSACGEEKPVYVGFGSLCVGHPGQATEKLLRAVKKAGVRCVMAGGWAGIGPHCLDSQAEDFEELKAFADAHVYHLEEAPHAWLLPRCCGALYHGGANTVGAVALAGIPGAIAPVAWDQPWWAEYMEKLEVGINLQQIISKVDEDMLVSAFLRLSNDRFLAQRAAGLAEKLKSEPSGAVHLADWVEKSLHLPHPWPTKHQREAMPRLQPLLWELKVEAADAGKVLGEERKLGGA